MEDLDVLEPQVTVVVYRGERLEIRPLTIGVLAPFARLVRPVMARFLDLGLDTATNLSSVDMALQLLDTHQDALFAAAAIATERPAEWIGKASADEFYGLARSLVEVNHDFFMNLLAPLLEARATISSGDGQTASTV